MDILYRRRVPSAVKQEDCGLKSKQLPKQAMEIKNKGQFNKKITLCVEFNFAQSFLLNIKVEFEPSFLPSGKLGRKMSPVDCVITHKNCTFEPETQFTQTAA